MRKNFDTPGPDLDTDIDFDSWKRRRTSLLQVTGGTGTELQEQVGTGTGLREEVAQGGGDETDHTGGSPISNTEREKGFKLKLNIVHNQVNFSKLGGNTEGVQRGGAGQAGGGVLTEKDSTKQLRDPRRVGSLFLSAELPDNAAAAVG